MINFNVRREDLLITKTKHHDVQWANRPQTSLHVVVRSRIVELCIPTPMRYDEVVTSETTQGEKTMTCRYGRMCRYTITDTDDYNTVHQWMVHNNGDTH